MCVNAHLLYAALGCELCVYWLAQETERVVRDLLWAPCVPPLSQRSA